MVSGQNPITAAVAGSGWTAVGRMTGPSSRGSSGLERSVGAALVGYFYHWLAGHAAKEYKPRQDPQPTPRLHLWVSSTTTAGTMNFAAFERERDLARSSLNKARRRSRMASRLAFASMLISAILLLVGGRSVGLLWLLTLSYLPLYLLYLARSFSHRESELQLEHSRLSAFCDPRPIIVVLRSFDHDPLSRAKTSPDTHVNLLGTIAAQLISLGPVVTFGNYSRDDANAGGPIAFISCISQHWEKAVSAACDDCLAIVIIPGGLGRLQPAPDSRSKFLQELTTFVQKNLNRSLVMMPGGDNVMVAGLTSSGSIYDSNLHREH